MAGQIEQDAELSDFMGKARINRRHTRGHSISQRQLVLNAKDKGV